MRKPDPPPQAPGTAKRSSSAAEHAPRRSLETSTSTESLASQHAAGVKRKKSRAQVDDEESDGGQADGEYGVRVTNAAGWVNDARRRSVAASSSATAAARRADGGEPEGGRHSMAV